MASLVSAQSASAFAAGEPARFVYVRNAGAESCPSEAAVRAAVRARLGYEALTNDATSTVFAEISAVEGGFATSVKLIDKDNMAHGARTLRARGRCDELLEALALSISIAIDPMSATRPPPPQAPPMPDEPRSPPAVAQVSNIDRGTKVEPTRDSNAMAFEANRDRAFKSTPGPPIVVSIGLGPLLSFGIAPSVAAGGALSLDAQYEKLFVGIEGRADALSSASTGLGRVESSLLAGSLVGGYRSGPFFVGGVGTLGEFAASSSDVAVSRDRRALYFGVGVRGGIALALTEAIEARFRAELLANVTRTTLEISNRAVYEIPIASGNVSAGLAFRFR